jgi:2-oxoglutarate dehydrogenase complex dehydrogenase (E1) component-like enzyme
MADFFEANTYSGVHLALQIKNHNITVADAKRALLYNAKIPELDQTRIIKDRNFFKSFLLNAMQRAIELMRSSKTEEAFAKFKTGLSTRQRDDLVSEIERRYNEEQDVDVAD